MDGTLTEVLVRVESRVKGIAQPVNCIEDTLEWLCLYLIHWSEWEALLLDQTLEVALRLLIYRTEPLELNVMDQIVKRKTARWRWMDVWYHQNCSSAIVATDRRTMSPELLVSHCSDREMIGVLWTLDWMHWFYNELWEDLSQSDWMTA